MTPERVGYGQTPTSEPKLTQAWGDRIDTLHLAHATRQQAVQLHQLSGGAGCGIEPPRPHHHVVQRGAPQQPELVQGEGPLRGAPY